MSQTGILSPTVHGCKLGELWLSEEEATKVNQLIIAAKYRFVRVCRPKTTVSSETSSPRPRPSTIKRKQAKSPPPQPAVGPDNTPAPKKKRVNDNPPKRKQTPSPPPPPVKSKAPQPPPRPATPPPQPEQPYLPPPTITEPLIVPPKKQPNPVLESSTATWTQAASAVLTKLETHPMSKSFIAPVNPQTAQNMADYFEKVKTPIDLQTIREKLENGMYAHPFRWQQDVRTIFYNAFTYHAENSSVWRQATELAVHFENLLKEEDGANPYAIFKRPPPEKPVVAPLVIPPQQVAVVEEPTTDGDKITMDAAEFKALLLQAASSGIPSTPTVSPPSDRPLAADKALPHPIVAEVPPLSVPSPPVIAAAPPPPLPTPITTKAKGKAGGAASQPLPPGVKIKDGLGVIYTLDCAHTPLAQELTKIMPVSALPPPCAVPPSENKTMPPSLSAGQKKTAMTKFKDLDVTYRKALLDLVKDELGIHSLLCAQDSRFIPEVDVLPTMKQRQFFLYLKSLVLQQKQAQDTFHLPATLPRVLSWNITPLPTNTSGQQDTSSTILGSSKKDSKMACVGGGEGLPWHVNRGVTSPSSSESQEENGKKIGSSSSSSSSSAQSSSSSASGSSSESEEEESEEEEERRWPLAGRRGGPAAATAQQVSAVPLASRPPAFHRPAYPVVAQSAQAGAPRPAPIFAHPLSRPTFCAPLPYHPHPHGHHPHVHHQAPPRMGFTHFLQAPTGLGKQRLRGDVVDQPRSSLGFWRAPPQAAKPQNPWPTGGGGGHEVSSASNSNSCWGEWKAKVMQETFLSQHRNVGVASERESRAEKAEAEI